MTDQTPGRTDRLRVRVVADPGLPTRRAHAVRDRLEQELADTYTQDVSVQVQSDLLRVDPGLIPGLVDELLRRLMRRALVEP